MNDENEELARSERLNEILDLYRSEAKRCRRAKAWLAGCVMAGAALEAGLLAMAECYPEEVLDWAETQADRKLPKEPTKWYLADLLDAAKSLGWLPASLMAHDEFDSDRALVGDYAEVVREIRNLVHAGRYVRDYADMEIAKEHLVLSLEVLEAAFDWLFSRLAESLKEAAKAEGWQL